MLILRLWRWMVVCMVMLNHLFSLNIIWTCYDCCNFRRGTVWIRREWRVRCIRFGNGICCCYVFAYPNITCRVRRILTPSTYHTMLEPWRSASRRHWTYPPWHYQCCPRQLFWSAKCSGASTPFTTLGDNSRQYWVERYMYIYRISDERIK